MRIAIATCASLPDWEVDDRPLLAAFDTLGVDAPVRLIERLGNLLFEMYNYDGPEKTFWEQALPGSFFQGLPQCGFYIELADRSGADRPRGTTRLHSAATSGPRTHERQQVREARARKPQAGEGAARPLLPKSHATDPTNVDPRQRAGDGIESRGIDQDIQRVLSSSHDDAPGRDPLDGPTTDPCSATCRAASSRTSSGRRS